MDEANDCRTIAQQTRADRHTLMFSATWPSSIQKLAAEFLCNPVKVTIGSQDLSASHSVTQVPPPPPPSQFFPTPQTPNHRLPEPVCQPQQDYDLCVHCSLTSPDWVYYRDG